MWVMTCPNERKTRIINIFIKFDFSLTLWESLCGGAWWWWIRASKYLFTACFAACDNCLRLLEKIGCVFVAKYKQKNTCHCPVTECVRAEYPDFNFQSLQIIFGSLDPSTSLKLYGDAMTCRSKQVDSETKKKTFTNIMEELWLKPFMIRFLLLE